MELHDIDYYNNIKMINAGMGIEYDIEYHQLLDVISARQYAERYSALQKKQNIIDNSKYYFLTINPKPSIKLDELIKVVNKLITKKWITNYLYVYEQRGENLEELGKGFHFHLIYERPKDLCFKHMLRELSNTSKSLCDTSNHGVFNLKNIDEEELKRKIRYITADKADPDKHLKQKMDVIFRDNNNLLSYYNIGIV